MNDEVYNKSIVSKKLSNISASNISSMLSHIWNVSNYIVLNLNCIPLLKKIIVFSFLKYYSWVIIWRIDGGNDAFPIRISKNFSKLRFLAILFTRRQKLVKNLIFVGMYLRLSNGPRFWITHREFCKCAPRKNFVGGNCLAIPWKKMKVTSEA